MTLLLYWPLRSQLLTGRKSIRIRVKKYYIHIVNTGIALRGATGLRVDAILDFGGMTTGHFGVLVSADNVTVADLTIRNTTDHGVSIRGVDRPVLYNLHILDANDQLVKVNRR